MSLTARVTRIVMLLHLVASCDALAAPLAPANPMGVGKAQRLVEAQGIIFENSHDAIVAKAKREGNLRALIGWDPPNHPHLISAFKKLYPFIDVTLEEISGSDAGQRFFLELKAGQVKNWDVIHIDTDHYGEFPPHLKKFDIKGMASERVLSIPDGMIDPKSRNCLALGNIVDVIGYNRNLISDDKVPASLGDFLKPEFKGRKFLTDIRPVAYAALAPGVGNSMARGLRSEIGGARSRVGKRFHSSVRGHDGRRVCAALVRQL